MCIRRMSYILLIVFLLTTSINSAAHSQSIDDIIPDFTPEEAAEIGKAFGTYTSATVVFTGRNAASTGNFSLDDDTGDFSIINIPISYTFGEQGDALRPRLRAALGQFSARTSFFSFFEQSELLKELDPEIFDFENRPDFRKDDVTSLTLGAGLVYAPFEGLEITPSLDLIWTHVKRRFDYNNLFSSLLGLKYDRDLFNNSTEAISYSPSLGVQYDLDLTCGYILTPSVLYTHIWSEDLWSKSQFANFSIDSGVFQGELELNIPAPFSLTSGDTDLRPFAKVTHLNGAVRDSLSEDLIYEFGANLAFDIESNYISELSIGAAYITASDFDGYRINLEGEW